MKKICFITTSSVTLKRFVLETAQALYKTGKYDISFICSPDKEFSDSLPEYIHYIPVKMKRGIDIGAFFVLLDFYKIFKREKFDMVQYSTPNASFYAAFTAKLAKIPVRLYCQWGIRYVSMSGLTRKIFKLIEKNVCNNSTDIRAVSRLNEKFSIDEGLYSLRKSFLLGAGGTVGVDVSHYDFENRDEYSKRIRHELSIGEDDFIFGFVGRASRDKGSNELIAAFKELSEEYDNLRLILIGSIEPQNGFDKSLIQWARNSDKVIILSNIENSELKYYYSAIDCYVHPSYREGFGLVLQEAGAMCTPILTTDIPGAGEVMVNGESCVLCRPMDKDDLKEKMRLIYNDDELRLKIAKNARIRTEKFFNRSDMLEAQIKYYNNLLEVKI